VKEEIVYEEGGRGILLDCSSNRMVGMRRSSKFLDVCPGMVTANQK
jgi:hypothetical protein